MPVQTTDEDIIKSPQDERQYRFLKLNNDLKVLLVSDVCTEKAAASLAVRVGYLCDPDNVPGLAHFCEHMLFLGTEKYPSENEYTEFLSHHGGSSNACTSAEYTTFFFDVAQEHLCGALDRFAQFFICPLFNADSKNREVNAVDSEHNKNRQVDGWRFQQVCKNTSRPHHPHRKFGTGNKHTLETHPQKQGIDVREELLKFHASHYSANVMSLVVLGKDSLDELASLVENLFSPVVNKNIPVPEFPEHPYSDDELQVWIEYVPVKELRQMSLDFPLPDLTEYYDSDPVMYVAHLIGHEGPGSLLSYLKVKGWCNTLVAGPSSGAKGYMFFSVTMDLTEEGEDHVEDVVTAVFQYLAMIRREGPKEWIFKECADLGAVDFRFKDEEKPRAYVHILSHNLHDFPPHEVLSAPYLLTHFRPDLIELVLDKLHSKNLRVAVVSKRFEGKTELTDPWYEAKYNFRKVDPSLIEQWSAVAHTEELHLPAPNEFIPTNFDIVPREENSPRVPALIQDTPMTKVWYKQDDTFCTPKACLYFQITTPVAYRDPESCDMINLLIRLLIDALNEYAYNAEIAGIQYKVMNNIYGFMVEVKGYNHKQSILLSKIMNKLANFKVDPKKFAIYHEIIRRKLRNFQAEQPHRHAVYYTSILLDSQMWTTEDLAEALEEITADQLQAFIPVLLSQVHIEALIHGNLSRQTCLELVGVVEDALRKGAGSKPLLPSQFARHRQVQLPDGSSYLYSIHNVVHDSCCVEIYLQVGLEATRPNMLLEMLVQIISEPCFTTLRTQEQLGYIVASGLRRSNGVQGLRFIVQSEKDATFVEQRVEAFLQHVQHHLESLTEEDFGRHRQALSVKRSEKPKKLKDECAKYWGEIISQQYHFVRDEVEVEYLKDITKEDLVKFFQEYISVSAPSRHKLAVHVVPLQKNTETKEPTVDEATVEKATVDEATVEKAMVEESTVEESTVEESTVEKSTVEESMVEESTVEKSTVEESTVEESTVEESTVEESMVEESTVEKSMVEKSTVEKSTVEKSTVEKATMKEATMEEVTMEEAMVDETTVEKAMVEKATIEEASVDEAIVEKAVVDEATVALGESADRGEVSGEEPIVKGQETTEDEGKPVEIEEADSIIESLVVKREVITDHFGFKNSLLLYPLVKPYISTSLPQ